MTFGNAGDRGKDREFIRAGVEGELVAEEIEMRTEALYASLYA